MLGMLHLSLSYCGHVLPQGEPMHSEGVWASSNAASGHCKASMDLPQGIRPPRMSRAAAEPFWHDPGLATMFVAACLPSQPKGGGPRLCAKSGLLLALEGSRGCYIVLCRRVKWQPGASFPVALQPSGSLHTQKLLLGGAEASCSKELPALKGPLQPRIVAEAF